MKRIFFFLFSIFLSINALFADKLTTGIEPKNALIEKGGKDWGLVEILSLAEQFLLKVALPLVIIGSALYVAYELFLAE